MTNRATFEWVNQSIKSYDNFGPLDPLEQLLLNKLKNDKNRLNALDIGCGYGRIGIRLAITGCSVRGVDCNKLSVETFNSISSQMQLEAQATCEYVENITLAKESWGVITAVRNVYEITLTRSE